MQNIIQNSFSAGELSPSLYARTDLAKYHVGAAFMRNFFVDYRGGASTRAGTEFVIQCLPGINRLIQFQFSTLQGYALLFSDLKMRVVKDGGAVLEASIAITGASQTDPGLITAVNTYTNGDWVWIESVAGMTQLNNRFFIIANRTAANFTLQDMDGNDIDSRNYDAYTSGGTVARVYTQTSPYAAADLALLKYVQNADTMTLTHVDYPPYQLTRSAHDNWTFTAITFQPSISTPTGASSANNSAGSTTYRYVVTGVGANNATESLPSNSASTAGATMSLIAAVHNSISWSAGTSGTAAASYNVYRQDEVPDGAPDPGSLYGFVGSTMDTSFVDANITPDFTLTPPIAYNPFASSNYPSCSTYYDGRQIYAGMADIPDGISASRPGDFMNMDYSNPNRPDDSIQETLIAQQVNAIKHLVPMQSMLALTAGGAWKIDAGNQADAITPTGAFSAKPQAYNGCSDVPPIVINYEVLYVQSKGSIIRDLSYNFYVNVFTGTDITVLSNHLFFGYTLTEWAYAEEPFKLIWAVRNDGALLSLTYIKEQEVVGWAHSDTQGFFKSVCVVSEPPEDAIYACVQRTIPGRNGGLPVQYVERMHSRNFLLDGVAEVALAWAVDSGLQYPLIYPDVTCIPSDPVVTITSVTVINGGSGYVLPSITDANNPLAVFAATLTGGVIASIVVLQGVITDPNVNLILTDSTGTGAQLRAVVENIVTLTADSAYFTAGMVGNVIRINQGVAEVDTFVDTTHVTVTTLTPFATDDYDHQITSPAGAWTCTAPVTTLRGLDHLEGADVTILAGGNVDNTQTVTDGAVTISHAQDIVTVGLPYKCQLQSLYLDVPGGPTIQGKRKKVGPVVVRVADSRGLKVGVGQTFAQASLREIKERTTQPMGQPIPLITGDELVNVDPSWDIYGQICIEQSYPLPSTILGLVPSLHVGDTPG